MACDNENCQSERLIFIQAKCSDQCTVKYGGKERDGYIPNGIGVSQNSEDFIELWYCLECGKIQGSFPISEEQIEEALSDQQL